MGGSPNGISYTLDFSTPLSSLSFTRIAQTTPNAVAQWTATAYAGTTAMGSVGESFFGGTEGAQTYSLSGSEITSLTFDANGYNLAGVSSAPMDDFYLTQAAPFPTAAPEIDASSAASGLTLLLGGLAVLRGRRGVDGVRRKIAT